jgi:hypothetical protein
MLPYLAFDYYRNSFFDASRIGIPEVNLRPVFGGISTLSLILPHQGKEVMVDENFPIAYTRISN